jgi:formylglycine-generating enzyme required for sulfatase activity
MKRPNERQGIAALSAAFLLVVIGGAVGCGKPGASPKPAEAKPVVVANPPQKGKPYENCLGMKFVPVPGTDVLFCVWKTRVQDFTAFVSATKYDATSGMYSTVDTEQKRVGATWEKPGFAQGPTHPVCGVCWDDAKAFCAWLTKKEQAEGRILPSQSYRLPTDLEWSAAIGLGREQGTTPAQRDRQENNIFPWGQTWPPPKTAGNYGPIDNGDDKFTRTSPVGNFPANGCGLYDLGSNLREWCEEFYATEGDVGRVLRGASWRDTEPGALRSSIRRNINPGRRSDMFGFRCVLVTGTAAP